MAQLFATLKEHGLQEKTLVVITADHGEEFLDHDFIEHGWTVYNESLNIPLIFWAPGKLPPQRLAGRVSTVDLLPTLLTLLQVAHQRDFLNGESFFKRQGEEFVFQQPTKPFIAELQMEGRSVLRAVIKDDWKYIQWRKWLTPLQCEEASRNVTEILNEYATGKRTRIEIWKDPVVHEALFNLADDPHELNNLLAAEPDKQEELGAEFRVVFKEFCRELGEAAGEGSSPSRPPSRVNVPDQKDVIKGRSDGGYGRGKRR